MREFFKRHDIYQKLLSLVLAIMIWAFVNAQPPAEKVAMTTWDLTAPVEIRNLEPGMEANNVPETVKIRLQAPSGMVAERQARAYVDLTGLAEGRHEVRVHVIVPDSASVISFAPQTADITLDAMVEANLPVQASLVGFPREGYTLHKPVVTPDRVTVRGSRTRLGQVQKVLAPLEVAGADTDLDLQVPVRLEDSAGEAVRGLEVEPVTVRVVVPVTRGR
ncbi:MAG: YbbR-like domain-containing protein [Syntrophothermus sp.]